MENKKYLSKISYRSEEWYKSLVDSCRADIVEGFFAAQMELIRSKWMLGDRIVQSEARLNVKFKKDKYYSTRGENVVEYLAKDIGKISTRELRRCIQFRLKYPEFVMHDQFIELNFDKYFLKDGKNISWYKICNKYLPAPKEDKKQKPLPEGKFDVIYADPPWQYSNSGITGAANNHYPTMETEEICKLKVPSAENAVLFLWVTNPFLKEGIQVCESWGFEYKTNMVWIKERAGQGFYVKGQHELLFIAVKGNFRPDDSLYIRSVVSEAKKEHSQKPEVFYEIIEKMYPNGKYLELFARNKRNKWQPWGNEI